jgi:hypothetical protein
MSRTFPPGARRRVVAVHDHKAALRKPPEERLPAYPRAPAAGAHPHGSKLAGARAAHPDDGPSFLDDRFPWRHRVSQFNLIRLAAQNKQAATLRPAALARLGELAAIREREARR